MKFLFFLVIMCITCFAVGSNCDTNKVKDTILIPQEKIKNITISCNSLSKLGEPKVINSRAEFDVFFGSDCYPTPSINFSTETLLFFPTLTSGCRTPEYKKNVKIIGTTIIYCVHIIFFGPCQAAIYNANCVVVPKINSNYTVDFEKTETIEEDIK